ncbi:hypothetical protein [Brevundimonas sp.]|uniref:hypothetical protein n=1 Tax=Brevundimonas sp. TaxID=1871086 RepID=UPI0035693769
MAEKLATEAGQKLFEATKAKWTSLKGRIATHSLGYFPLYGPPIENPSLLIVSDQPGAGAHVTADQLTPDSWPDALSYIDSAGRFAGVLKQIVEPDILKRSVATAAIVFRAKSLEQWKRAGDASVIRDAEEFSADQVRRLALALRPRMILTSGGKSKAVFLDASAFSGVDYVQGSWRNIPILACKHLSGQHNHSIRQPAVIATLKTIVDRSTGEPN